MLVCVAIILLVVAAMDGNDDKSGSFQPTRPGIPYPQVPVDLDPEALDFGEPVFVAPRVTPQPLPVVPRPTRPNTISAEAFMVADLETGQTSVGYNTKRVYPIASLSKLVTAIIAVHTMGDRQVTITQPMLDAYGDAGRLILGETYAVSELLNPLLLESSNDAAEAFAQTYGYVNFIKAMNDFVKELGMNSTSFRDASGLSSGNVSNVEDLLKLSRYLYQQEKELLTLTRQPSASVASTTLHAAHTWKSINPFPYDPHFIGGKTGRTIEAKESMISLFNYTVGAKTYPVAIIVLRSEFHDRETDTSLLLSRFIKTVDSSI